MDQPLAVTAIAVGGVEHCQVLILEMGSAFNGLLSAHPFGRFPDLSPRESEGSKEIELECGVLVRLETESLHRRFTQDKRVENVPELIHVRQSCFDLAHVFDGEALLQERPPVDMGSADQGAGPDDEANDVLDLLLRIPEILERGRDRLVDDLEVAATGQLLELDESEVRLDPGGITIHLQTDGAGRRDNADLSVAKAVKLSHIQGEVPGLARRGQKVAWCEVGIDPHHEVRKPLIVLLTGV